MKQFLTLFAALLLSACATNATRPQVQNGQLQAPAGQGLAIISLSGEARNHVQILAYGYMTINGPAGKTVLNTEIGSDDNQFIQAPGSAINPQGKVFVVALPPGNYTVGQVYGSWSPVGALHHVGSVPFDIAVNIPFTVKAGQVQYLGRGSLDLSNESNVSFFDQDDVDLYDVQLRYNVTDFSNVVQNPLMWPMESGKDQMLNPPADLAAPPPMQ